MIGYVVRALILVAATAFGIYRRATDGALKVVGATIVELPADDTDSIDLPASPNSAANSDVRASHDGDRMSALDLGAPLGPRATLVQFSSAFCAPCRTTRVVLDEVAGMLEGVAHVEIDAEDHLDLVRRLDVRRTPTVLVLDSHGAVRVRAAGAPRKADVIAALGTFV